MSPRRSFGLHDMSDNKVKGRRVTSRQSRGSMGRPVGEWQELVAATGISKHMEMAAWLKSEHGIGHGHANAIVADLRARQAA